MVRGKFSPRRTDVTVNFAGKVSRTKQAMKEECDINNIMRKYVKTGAVNHVNKHGGQYGFASAITFHESMNVVRKAEEMFLELPAKLRRKFENDPAVFLEFVQDDKNLPEMRELGLAKPDLTVPAVVPAPSGSSSAPPPAGGGG